MSILEIFTSLGSNIWLYGGAFLLVLSVLVFVHEWGHYIVARLCGIRVEVFSIGFGKELFGYTDKHDTRWKFSLIPLGGYVKMYGDVDPASSAHDTDVKGENGKIRPMSEEEKKVAFFAKPVWKRALVVFAGPAINYIFAIIILSILFSWNGKPVTPPIAGAVVVGSSADKAGFKPGDVVIKIDGTAVKDFEGIRRFMMISLDAERVFEVERADKIVELSAKPEIVVQEDRFGFKHSRGVLGLMSPQSGVSLNNIVEVNGRKYSDKENVRQAILNRLGQAVTIKTEKKAGDASEFDVFRVVLDRDLSESLRDPEALDHDIIYFSNLQGPNYVQYGFFDSIVKSFEETWSITAGTIEALGQIVVGTRSTKELGGIVRIGAMAGDMASQGVVALVFFTALLSINLGLINLFPIPLLDGGHLVFYAVEAVLGEPIPEKVQDYAFRAGFVFLIGLMVFANINDILQMIL